MYFRRYLLIVLSMILSSVIEAQTGPYWLLGGGSNNYDEGLDMSIDSAGNTYTTGYFSGICHFGSITLTSAGVTDIFIAKVDPEGNYLWVVKAGGLGPDKGNSITSDLQGNSYVTGFYQGSATFGSTVISSVGSSQDVFLAKYNNQGVLQWVKSAGGTLGDLGSAVSLDNNGNVVITGQFAGNVNFGTQNLVSMNDPGTGQASVDVFVAKYNTSNGNVLWAKKGSASHTDRGLDIACDAGGNIYVIGHFSDTITFDVPHNNNMLNCIFLIKYNPSGAEQWFRKIGASSQSVGYGIAVNNNADVFITGDFSNQLMFFGTSTNTLTCPNTNGIFIAKYSGSGNFLWAKSESSESEITSRCIVLDNASNAYITGSFKCKLNSLANVYGQGTFNSVGFWDVFAVKLDASGNRLWAGQSGGKNEDKCYSITVNEDNDMFICGGFYNKILFPASSHFIIQNNVIVFYNYSLNYAYCNDINYELFYGLNSSGASDIFICKGFDPSKNPYDYYYRENSTTCLRPYVGVELQDSIKKCGNAPIYLNPNSGLAGPDYTYLWSTGSTFSSILVTSGGLYSVTQTSADGCFVSKDTVVVTIYPNPPKPTISDSKGININAINTIPVNLCVPDSVILTGGNICTGCTGAWLGVGTITGPHSIRPLQSGMFTFQVTDTHGCTSSNNVMVTIDSMLTMPNISLYLSSPDTVDVCQGEGFPIYVIENIFNNTYPQSYYYHTSHWSCSPPILIDSGTHTMYCYPVNSGWYNIYLAHDIKLQNFCDADSVTLYDTISIFVNLLTAPHVNLSLSGNTLLCPGDSTTMYAISNATNIIWNGPGIVGPHNLPTAVINSPGNYTCTASISDSNGCSDQESIPFSIVNIPNPVVTMNPSNGVICANDSVVLMCNGYGSFSWYGPMGHFGGNQNSITVNLPGLYYCVRTDTNGCTLISNTAEVVQYATPYLTGDPSTVICPGGNITIQVITNPGSIIQWQPPLSGSSLSKVISVPGTYSCNVTSCNIVTPLSITVTMSSINAIVTSIGPSTICAGDSVILNANSGGVSYHWSNGSSSSSIVVYQPGTYTVTITDNNGCVAISAPITIGGSLVSPPLTSDVMVCYGVHASLAATASGPVQWFTVPAGGAAFYTGNNYITSPILSDTVFYIQTYDPLCPSMRIPINVTLFPGSGVPVIHTNSPLCVGDTIHIYFTPDIAAQYSWTGPDGFTSNLSDIAIPDATINQSGTYTLVISSDSCPNLTVPVNIEVDNYPEASFTYSLEPTCEGVKVELITTSPVFTDVEWHFSDGYSSNNPGLSHVFNFNDTATINLIVSTNNCRDTTQLSIPMVYPDLISLPPPNVFTPNGDGLNDCFRLKTAPGYSDCYEMEIYNRWGRRVFKSEAGNTCWNGKDQQDQKDCAAGVYYFVMTVGTQSYHGSVTLMR